ncbi:synaptotagmin-5-like [Panicum miliaceum]|uniref:Synaptotagmin-5-like n=1 Tax=Panicum miliaceum TaxID=4540 RepID=A0A3L6TJ75_PANMI|nr:synaptotagmin-5-like [Panicum miliaceum]
MGMIVGVALIACWARAMARRAAKRSNKASATASPRLDLCKTSYLRTLTFSQLFLTDLPMEISLRLLAADITSLGSLNREDVKKICGENVPQWISFPEYEQVKWLNKQLSKLWPFVEEDTVASLITDMLQWPHRIVVPLGGVDVDVSDLELKPHGKLTVTVVRADSLKNKELIGKSDPYVVLFIRPMFREKTSVIDDNLNPQWNETFELIAEDKETHALILEVFDEDKMKQDKRLGIAKLPLSDLGMETVQEVNLQLLPSLDTTKVVYHQFTKAEAQEALELEKRTVEERRKVRSETAAVSGAADASNGAASTVTNVAGTGVATAGTSAGSGTSSGGSGGGMVGTGIGAVGSGIGAFGSGLSKAGKFVGRTVTGPFSSARRSASSVPSIDD